MRRLKSGCYKILVPLYGITFYVAFSNSDAFDLTGIDYAVGSGAFVEYHEDPPLMILMDHGHEVVIHECTHAALCLMGTIGIAPDVDNQEPMAYLMGYIADQVYECLVDYWARNA